MQTMNIDQILEAIYPLPEPSATLLKAHIRECSFPKGHVIIKADTIARKIYFIKQGIVRAYAYTDGNELTFWFGREGETVLSMKSYVEQRKGYEDIVLLEDCDLYELDAATLHDLFARDIHIANWGRRFAELELVKTEERLISRQFRNATERYKALLEDNPDLVRRVPLGHIASFLGITQVSLSRIRSDIR